MSKEVPVIVNFPKSKEAVSVTIDEKTAQDIQFMDQLMNFRAVNHMRADCLDKNRLWLVEFNEIVSSGRLILSETERGNPAWFITNRRI